MKVNLKSKVSTLLVSILISTVIAGCTKKPQEITMVIPENKSEKQQELKFELSNLTKIEGKGTIKGWINENELLTASATHLDDKDEFGRHKWFWEYSSFR